LRFIYALYDQVKIGPVGEALLFSLYVFGAGTKANLYRHTVASLLLVVVGLSAVGSLMLVRHVNVT
jgi:hypothetical protein